MYSIGEFSRITGLSIQTLRFYHEQKILIPARIDAATGYRFYDDRNLECAQLISELRKLEFPIAEIAEILQQQGADADLMSHLERQKSAIETRVQQYRNAMKLLDKAIKQERDAQALLKKSSSQIEEKELPPMLIAGVRIKGKYSECGKGFGKIGRSFGGSICGAPFCLYYDEEYRENDADFEACMPIKQARDKAGIDVRELSGGRAVTLQHRGPYEMLGRSYAKIFRHLQAKGQCAAVPCREVYHKGPGMIFRGNPENYLTEIQIVLAK